MRLSCHQTLVTIHSQIVVNLLTITILIHHFGNNSSSIKNSKICHSFAGSNQYSERLSTFSKLIVSQNLFVCSGNSLGILTRNYLDIGLICSFCSQDTVGKILRWKSISFKYFQITLSDNATSLSFKYLMLLTYHYMLFRRRAGEQDTFRYL